MSSCNKEFKIDTHLRAAFEVEEMSVSWILSQEKWQGSNEEQKGCSIIHTTSTIRLVLHIFNSTCSNHSIDLSNQNTWEGDQAM